MSFLYHSYSFWSQTASYLWIVPHWMDWSLKLKCCAFAIASVTLGCSAVYVHRRATSNWKRSKVIDSREAMAAAAEIDCQSNPVSQLVSTMEKLKVAQQPTESPQPHIDEVEIPDRDSANHSPSDFLSGNLHSDSHSEVMSNNTNYVSIYLTRYLFFPSFFVLFVELKRQWQRWVRLCKRKRRSPCIFTLRRDHATFVSSSSGSCLSSSTRTTFCIWIRNTPTTLWLVDWQKWGVCKPD